MKFHKTKNSDRKSQLVSDLSFKCFYIFKALKFSGSKIVQKVIQYIKHEEKSSVRN